MKISYKWLKEYIDIDLSIDELAQKITDSGIEVEEIISLVPEYTNIVLGKVVQKEKHPDADKLSICKVSTGTEEFQVICGAPNVESGQMVPFAFTGAVLPNGMKIKKAKIRGVESYGMICSKEELGLEVKSDGIWPLETDQLPGTDINRVLENYHDYILDLFVTSNRPDCLSHIGIAREIAAFTGKKVKWPDTTVVESVTTRTEDNIDVFIGYNQGCPRYAARVIKNVKIGPSPDWLVQKLEAIGLRAINNVVDVTNFVLNELGQPLHAFDYDLIEDKKIIVRSSKKGEKFKTLDDKERVLPENTVMICDGKKPVAIGGIMGGQNSEVSDSTKNILLESAYFNPENIALSTRKLEMMTDASQRFEKGTDYDNVLVALNRAAGLIRQLAGGEILAGVLDCYPETIDKRTVAFNPRRVNRILGSSLEDETIFETLAKLNLAKTEQGIAIPSYRVDINEEIDLIEEVARLTNLDNLPTSIVEPVYIDQQTEEKDFFITLIREALVGLGLQEIFTNSMLSTKTSAKMKNEHPVKILNPISDDLSTMRTSLLPGILTCIEYNQNRYNTDLKIFEIGRIFLNKSGNALPEQPVRFAFALTGLRQPQFWENQSARTDFYDLKGLTEALFDKLHIENIGFEIVTDLEYFENDFVLDVSKENQKLGIIGKVNTKLSSQFGIEKDIFFADFSLDHLIKFISGDKKYKIIGKYPYIEKDLALIFENNIPAVEVIKFIKSQGGKLLRKVDIFDVYSGQNISENLKSVAFRLVFQSDERTLQDNEVDQIFRKIIRQTEKEFNASLRDK